MHAAQMAKWKQINWDHSALYEQRYQILQALEHFVKAYCKARNVKWIHEDKADAQGKLFFDKLFSTAQKEDQPHNIAARLWTSAAKLQARKRWSRGFRRAIGGISLH